MFRNKYFFPVPTAVFCTSTSCAEKASEVEKHNLPQKTQSCNSFCLSKGPQKTWALQALV